MTDRKTLFITGASSGIGAATARAAVHAGWNVGIMARSENKLARMHAELGEASHVVAGDVTDLAAQQGAIAATVARFGGLTRPLLMRARASTRPARKTAIPRNGVN